MEYKGEGELSKLALIPMLPALSTFSIVGVHPEAEMYGQFFFDPVSCLSHTVSKKRPVVNFKSSE